MSALRRVAAGLVLGSVVVLAGCATARNPDPLEPWNRKVFAFNETVDDAVLRPVATTYRDVVPSPVRTGVSNFYGNVKDLWSMVNLFLQGRPGDALQDMIRFTTNTVFGLYGLIDVAGGIGIERVNEDLGQTLGVWGFGPGAYVVWPIIGPSSARDSVGLPFDLLASPSTLITPMPARYASTGLEVVNTRANLLKATGLLDDIALDKYVFIRDAYLQRRRSLVYEGEPPEEELPPEDDAAIPAAPAASQP